MKLKHLFFAAAAAVLAFAACEPEETIGVPDLQVTPSSVSFQAGASSQTVTLTASRDWTVSGAPEWLAFDPSSGKASDGSQTVTITAMANSGYNRSTDVTFTIGLMKAYVHVDQTGEKGVKDNGKGTVESPFSVEGVKAYIDGLDNPSVVSPDKVYIKGKISRINDKGTYGESGTFSNATFYISDDGTTDNEFYCYRIAYLGNKKYSSGQTDIQVGDEVVVYGNVILYGSSNPVYETSQGTAYLYSLNGETGPGSVPAGDPKGTGAKDDPFNVAAALNAVKDLGWTSNSSYDKVGPFYVKGKISRIADKGTYGESGTYSNATFYISDDGSTNNEFYCYRISYLGNKKFSAGQTDIQVGDEVIIYGELMNYRSDTPETVQGSAYLYSLNGNTGGGGDTPPGPSGEAKGTGTKEDPFNPVGAANAVKNLTWTSNDSYETTGEVYVKGKISRIASKGTFGESGTYGNASFYISEDGTQTNEFYCFRILYLGNEKYTSGTDIKVGDEVIVCGQLMNYKGNTPETVAGKAFLYSLNGQTSGGGGGDTPPGPSGNGSGTLSDPYTPAGAIAAVANLTWTSNTDYQKTEKVYVKGKISKIANKGTYGESGDYGNASYYISADGTENGEFQIFRSLYFNGEKYTSGTDIKVGDEVIVYGALMNYKGTTPETVAGENWLYSLNGATSGGGGGDTPPSGDGSGTLNNPYTPAQAIAAVANLTWTSNTEYDKTDKVYVKGKISKIANNGTYTQGGTYGNASYYISADGTENEEFYIFRSLYFNGEKYTSGTDIKVGDEVIVYGALMNYKGNTPETVANENWLYSLNGATSGGSGDSGQGQGQGGGEATGTFASNVSWTSGTDGAYNEKATVNGTADVPVLKLGTSSKTGTSTLTLPDGSTSLTFYALSWKGKPSKVVFSVNGEQVGSVEPAANDGLSNSSPYTLTVTDSDKYTVTFPASSTLTVETTGSNTRVALFGVQAK